jgi:hypothetical protein
MFLTPGTVRSQLRWRTGRGLSKIAQAVARILAGADAERPAEVDDGGRYLPGRSTDKCDRTVEQQRKDEPK